MLLLLCCAIAGSSQTNGKAVEITAEPDHHLALSNKYTRVFKVEVPPHQPTLLHHHAHDYVFVTLGRTEIENRVEGKPPVTLKLQDGDTRFAAGNFSHVAVNLTDAPFRNVTIEILKKAAAGNAAPQGQERGLEIGHGGLSEVVIDNDTVRVSDNAVAGSGMLHQPNAHKWPALLVAVTDLELHAPAGGKTETIRLKAGDIKWSQGGLPEVMNMAKQQVRFISVEFK